MGTPWREGEETGGSGAGLACDITHGPLSTSGRGPASSPAFRASLRPPASCPAEVPGLGWLRVFSPPHPSCPACSWGFSKDPPPPRTVLVCVSTLSRPLRQSPWGWGGCPGPSLSRQAPLTLLLPPPWRPGNLPVCSLLGTPEIPFQEPLRSCLLAPLSWSAPRVDAEAWPGPELGTGRAWRGAAAGRVGGAVRRCPGQRGPELLHQSRLVGF